MTARTGRDYLAELRGLLGRPAAAGHYEDRISRWDASVPDGLDACLHVPGGGRPHVGRPWMRWSTELNRSTPAGHGCGRKSRSDTKCCRVSRAPGSGTFSRPTWWPDNQLAFQVLVQGRMVVMRNNPSEQSLDLTTLSSAHMWCTRDEPSICAGVDQAGDTLIFYRKDEPGDVASSFDAEAARRYPASQIKRVRWSFSDLANINAELQADAPYWAEQAAAVGWDDLGIAAMGWTIYEPAQGNIAICGVPPKVIDMVNELLDARYGSGKVRAIATGGPMPW